MEKKNTNSIGTYVRKEASYDFFLRILFLSFGITSMKVNGKLRFDYYLTFLVGEAL